MGKYLINHINKGLSVVPAQTLDRLSLITVREDVCDQGNAFICGERTVNQAFPRWSAAACEELIRPI